MSEGDRLFERVQNFVHDTAIPLSKKKLKFNKRDEYEFFVVACYLSILEKTWAILALVDKELGAHSLPILRSQLDNFADLQNLLSDKDYLNHLRLTQLDSEHKKLCAAKKGNPYLETIAKWTDLEERLSIVGKNKKYLENLGAKKLEPKDKLARANLKFEHEALYPRLSDSVHGGLDSMIGRHFKESGDDFEVVGFPAETKDECIPSMQTAMDISLRASLLIHEHFETGSQNVFEEMIAEQT